MNIIQTMMVLISLLIFLSRSGHTYASSNSDPNCDYVVESNNYHEAIGVCIDMGDKSFRTDYDKSKHTKIVLSFESNDCSGKSVIYRTVDVIDVNLGTGNLCKTLGAYFTYVSYSLNGNGNYELISQENQAISGFDQMMPGFCKHSPSTDLYYVVDYCKDGVIHWRWFFDEYCSDEIQQKRYIDINQDNDDIEWKTIFYYRSHSPGDVSSLIILLNEDQTKKDKGWYTDIVCVPAQNKKNKKNKISNKGGEWSKY